jgi:ornithine cyclodeaminase/alanine dehydrogenase-like protein (mu-crystallin family)
MKQPPEVVRLHPEPFAYVTEADVHEALTARPEEYLRSLKGHLWDIARGVSTIEMPPKQLFTDPDQRGDFRVMPCVLRSGTRVVKTVKIVGTNVRQQTVPDQVTVGKAFRLHPEENYITHVFEACLLSSARTGACAALAMKHLAPVRRRFNIVGAGRVSYYAALYAMATDGVEEICFHDLLPERAARMAEEVARASAGRIRCRAAAASLPQETDVLLLATTATQAFCRPGDSRASLVISVGADTEDQHELHSDWARRSDLYVDTLDSARAGDLREWLAAGLLSLDDVKCLLDLIRDGARPTNGHTRVFISTGSALFDNLTITYLLEAHPAVNGKPAALSAALSGSGAGSA